MPLNNSGCICFAMNENEIFEIGIWDYTANTLFVFLRWTICFILLCRCGEGINVRMSQCGSHFFMYACLFHMWIFSKFHCSCCCCFFFARMFVISTAWLSIFFSCFNVIRYILKLIFLYFRCSLFHFTTFHRMIAFFLLRCAKAAFNEKVSYYYAPSSSSSSWYRDLLL